MSALAVHRGGGLGGGGAVAPCRDRTGELLAVAERLRAKLGDGAVGADAAAKEAAEARRLAKQQHSEFAQKAAIIGRNIHATSTKLAKLAKRACAGRRPLGLGCFCLRGASSMLSRRARRSARSPWPSMRPDACARARRLPPVPPHAVPPSLAVAKRTSMFDDPAAEIQELTAVVKVRRCRPACVGVRPLARPRATALTASAPLRIVARGVPRRTSRPSTARSRICKRPARPPPQTATKARMTLQSLAI